MSTPDPQPPTSLAKAIERFDADHPRASFSAAQVAAAYRRGMLRAAQMAEDYTGPSYRAVERLAAAIRSEADTPGTA